MAIQKLTALERGNPANSSGADAASAVNSLIDQAQSTEDLLQDLGTFNQDIIRDNVSVKDAIQDLETFAKENIDRIIVTTTRNSAVQNIPNHDGTDATEIAIDIGEATTETHTVGPGGVVVLLQDLHSISIVSELHVSHTGGQASTLVVWVEISTDGGLTWILTPEESLRSESIDKNGDSMLVIDLSVDTPVPVGAMFRMMATNVGVGTLAFAAPNPLTTSKGVAYGFATKAIIKAKIS